MAWCTKNMDLIYDAASRFETKFKTILKNKNWSWKPARWKELVSIQRKLSLIEVKDGDKAMWIASKSGKYNCASTFDELKDKTEKWLDGNCFGFNSQFLSMLL